MEIVQSYAVRHKDGYYVNVHWEPVKGINSAFRSKDQEGLLRVLNGVHKPTNPEDFYLQKIIVTYQEDNEDVQKI